MLQITFECDEVPLSVSTDYIVHSVFDTTQYTITTTDNNVTIDNILGNNYYQVDVVINYADGEALIENITQISESVNIIVLLLLGIENKSISRILIYHNNYNYINCSVMRVNRVRWILSVMIFNEPH